MRAYEAASRDEGPVMAHRASPKSFNNSKWDVPDSNNSPQASAHFCSAYAACVFDTPKKPKKITEDQCRNESTFHVYNCQCGDLYNARQRLRVGGV